MGYDQYRPRGAAIHSRLKGSAVQADERIGGDVVSIEGVVPDILQIGEGCGFASRCPEKMEKCTQFNPPLEEVAPAHYAACWLHTDERDA